MKVSVIIIAYNIENYIEKCLLSILNQTFKDIEVIIVNDGSTDNTLEKIINISEKDDRVAVINQENKGVIEARNSGFNAARGEYILFVDGDDWLELNALELLYENAIYNKSDIVIYDVFLAYDDNKKLLPVLKENISEKDYLKCIFKDDMLPSIWSKFIKVDFIKRNNIKFPRNISFAEDYATVVGLFIHNPNVSIVRKPLYNYYKRENSITNTKNQKILEVDEAHSFIKELLIEEGIYEQYKLEFEYIVYMHFFRSCLTQYWSLKELRVKLYNQYKIRNIDINNNLYIVNEISKYPLSLKIRVKLYNKNYNYGIIYDKLRILFNKKVCSF